MASDSKGKPPYPPFTAETAQIKVKAAQDAWNTKWVYPIPLLFSLEEDNQGDRS